MQAAPRVLAGGVWHETNSFSPVGTDLDAFRRFLLAEDAALLDVSRGTNTEIGGMMEGAAAHGLDLLPALWGGAAPSGMVSAGALAHFVDGFLAAIDRHAPLDGVLVALHGAMVAEGVDEADAHLLHAIRDRVGPACPIVATIDYHANVSARLVEAADVLIGYDTLPHVDMAERGREAAQVMAGLVGTHARPAKAFRKLKLLTVPQMQGTGEAPMRDIMELRAALERGSDVLTCSVVAGFPYCDVPHLGAAVLAYGAAAEIAADRLADALWARRADFAPSSLAPAEAVRQAVAANHGPVFLMEPADNVGGGAPGDGTTLLRALIEGRADRAACVIWDPPAAAAAVRAGVGERFAGAVGGRTLTLHGPPLPIEGTVTFAGEVRYRRDSTWMTGQPANLGLVAAVRVGGVTVVLTTERALPFDTMHLRAVGVAPEEAKVIVVKCGSAWRGIFGDMARAHHYVDTPGVCTSHLERMPYTRLARPMYPLDPAAPWGG